MKRRVAFFLSCLAVINFAARADSERLLFDVAANGDYFLTNDQSTGNREVHVYDVASSYPRYTFRSPAATEVTAFAATRESHFFAAGLSNGAIHFYDIGPNQTISVLEGHSEPVTAVDFIRQRSYLISACQDGRIILWDSLAGILLREFLTDLRPIKAIYTADPDSFLALDDRGNVHIYSIHQPDRIRLYGPDRGDFPIVQLHANTFSKDAILLDESNRLRVIRVASGSIIAETQLPKDATVTSIYHTPDSNYVMLGLENNSISILPTLTLQEEERLTLKSGKPLSIRGGKNDDYFFVYTEEQVVEQIGLRDRVVFRTHPIISAY